ncbi:hypothetical protein [Paludisphaera mucosa]|uniref:Uncharacterized protein n=1 Tax=Paludisphaera mucosa TaxID=3030827 RepID=A0ABT6FJL5_9BACT|nr:hypothetical protein [Paludisphaera mucosa]MDG3007729.1 hypothetical protein [Paludisphaera mucosa]
MVHLRREFQAMIDRGDVGPRFVEWILTAVESRRRQPRDILLEAVEAHRSGRKPLSLVSAGA